jgi:DNA-binding response OmpR family regulator
MRSEKNPEELKQYKMMHANGRKLLRLINDLMELAKLDQGVLEFNPTQEDIHRFIRTVVASFDSQAIQNKIKFKSKISEEAYIMAFDMSKVETIIINLLTSVLKFTPSGGSVAISTSITQEHFKFIVSNDGSQIPVDEHDKIFERFYQTDSAEFYDGYGIGLALAKELTSMHGGEITIDSIAGGNTFTISLPINNASHPLRTNKNKMKASPKYSLSTESEKVSKKPVVLLVEDNTDLRKYLRKVLEEDFTLYEGANGAEGVALAGQHLPDLIISDVMMPIKDGFELCFEIKSTEVTSHIPVLLLTAKADMESKLEGLKTGADYYLAKPFEPRELLTASNNLIAQRKKLRENFSKKLLLQPKEWEGASADERFLQKLMEFTEEKVSEPDFSVEDMQQEMGISRMQLHRKLKALTDQSATEFIRTIRLKRAAEMLQKDFDNVSQVAYQVGFSSLSYFTKCFKEQYGTLPSEYSSKKSTIS